MEEELNAEVESLIITLDGVIDKEYTFVTNKNNSWATKDTLNKRIEAHRIVFLLTETNVSYADKLFSLATKFGDDDKPIVKSMIKKLSAFFELYESQYEQYKSEIDLTHMLENSSDEDSENLKNEIKFRSDITSNIASLRSTMLKIARLSDKTKVVVPLFNDRPMPILMRARAEETFPDVKEMMNIKMNN